MPTHSSTLAWRIPWTEGPGGLQSVGSQKSWTRLRRSHNKQTNFKLFHSLQQFNQWSNPINVHRCISWCKAFWEAVAWASRTSAGCSDRYCMRAGYGQPGRQRRTGAPAHWCHHRMLVNFRWARRCRWNVSRPSRESGNQRRNVLREPWEPRSRIQDLQLEGCWAYVAHSGFFPHALGALPRGIRASGVVCRPSHLFPFLTANPC